MLKRDASLKSLHEKYWRARASFSASSAQFAIAESGFTKAKALADGTAIDNIRQRANEQTITFINQKIQALKDVKEARERLVALLPQIKLASSQAVATTMTDSSGDYLFTNPPSGDYFVFLEFRLPDWDSNLFFFEEVSGQGTARCDMKSKSFIPY